MDVLRESSKKLESMSTISSMQNSSQYRSGGVSVGGGIGGMSMGNGGMNGGGGAATVLLDIDTSTFSNEMTSFHNNGIE